MTAIFAIFMLFIIIVCIFNVTTSGESKLESSQPTEFKNDYSLSSNESYIFLNNLDCTDQLFYLYLLENLTYEKYFMNKLSKMNNSSLIDSYEKFMFEYDSPFYELKKNLYKTILKERNLPIWKMKNLKIGKILN